jgi:phytoene synthase
LLDLAHEALESHHPSEPVRADARLLRQAYQYCQEITRTHSRTFYLASGLLPNEKRQAVRALYAFCRVSDDLVDRPMDQTPSRLQDWRSRALSSHPPQDDLVALAWADARSRYHIPRRYAEQLIEGVARDLVQSRYATFEELSDYCYGVASTVGLMAMHIIGFQSTDAIRYAVKLGIALQLTNILRDVAEDWQNGRLYLPLEELEEFGIREEDIAAGRLDDRWRRFLSFQIQRNRSLYVESNPGIQLLNPDGRFAIAAAAELYRAVLEDIEAHQGDVFSRRAHVGAWNKLRRLPGIWRRSRG